MRGTVYQPQFLPRLHYFARLLNSDIFVIADYLQFVKAHSYPTENGGKKRGKSFQADTPIKNSNGILTLSVPVRHLGLLPINKTQISYENGWNKNHITNIHFNYKSACNYEKIQSDIEKILSKRYASLGELTITTILWALSILLEKPEGNPHALTIEKMNQILKNQSVFRLKRIVLASDTGIPPSGERRDANDWLIDLCRHLSIHEYVFGGTAASAYMNFDHFKKAGIDLHKQEWICKPYRQQFEKIGFLSNLSILDLIANEEPSVIYSILRDDT